MLLTKQLFVKLKPIGTKKVKNEDGEEVEKQLFEGIPETCLCTECHRNPNQVEFINMSFSGQWKEIDPNLPGNERFSCTVCGYPITEREVGE